MKIVHIAPNAPYNDNWGYQENLLPKYHVKCGHEVYLIVSNKMHKDGKIVKTDCDSYTSDDGVMIIRRDTVSYFSRIVTNIRSHMKVLDCLMKINPDLIFFHGLASDSIYEVVKYKKTVNPKCVIVQDNHLDYNIGRSGTSFKDKLVRAYNRHRVRQTIEHVNRVYGVTPWRKMYAEEYYKVPKTKTDVLIMGADDEKVDLDNKGQIRSKIRKMHGVAADDYLIVTGGKIDARKGIDILIKACAGIKDVKLLVFGAATPEFEEVFNEAIDDSDNAIFVGWIPSDLVYSYFFAADLVVFPGQHSVLWEQACACKVPCVFKKWEGMDHVNNGGNSAFMDSMEVDDVRQKITELVYTPIYEDMKGAAESEKTDIYLYSNIAHKSLECARM